MLSLVFLIVSSIIVPISAESISGNTWVEKTPMPNGYAYGAVTINGEIYTMGSNFTYLYKPLTDTWISKTPMPKTNDGGFATTNYQNKIYVFGGINGKDPNNGYSIPTGTSEVYSPSTDTWDSIAPMPTPRGCLQANVVNGKIYLISGGLENNSAGSPSPVLSNANEVYDPSSNSWTKMAPIPTPVEYYASGVVDNKIYVIGGMANTSSGGDLTQIYDTETNTWSFGQPPPFGFWGAQAGVTTGVWAPTQIYVPSMTQVYDPQTNSWTNITSPIRSGGLVAVVNDTLYVMQGAFTTTQIFGAAQVTVNGFNEQYFPIGYQDLTPSLSQFSTVKPPNTKMEPLPTVTIIAVVISAVLVGAGVLIYFRRRGKP